MEVRTIDISTAESVWSDFHARAHKPLAQHSLVWQRMLAAFDLWQWRACALFEDDHLMAALPFCLRRTEIGAVAMSSPVAASYGGVLYDNRTNREEAYAHLLDAFVAHCKHESIDLAVILSSPFRDDLDLYTQFFAPDYSMRKFYQYLETTNDPSVSGSRNFRKSLRKNIEAAEQVSLSFKHSHKPDASLLRDWHQHVLSPRLENIGTQAAPLRLFEEMFRHSGTQGLCRFAWVEHRENVVAGGVFLFGYAMDVYLRASTEGAMKQGAGMLLDFEMIKEAAMRGCAYVNFQSSPSRESPSYEYKRRWGCMEGETAYMVKVLSDVAPFVSAGKEAVAKAFPHVFVLPHSLYED